MSVENSITGASCADAWRLAPPIITAAARAAGLSGAEATARLTRSGPNVFRDHTERALLVQFILRFKNPLVIILLLASAISAFTGEVANFVIISLIVVLSVTLDFVQEYRAGKAAEKLRLAVSVRTTVVRDGKNHDIPVADVVPGDIVVLSAGDLVPADGVHDGADCGRGARLDREHPRAPADNRGAGKNGVRCVLQIRRIGGRHGGFLLDRIRLASQQRLEPHARRKVLP